MTIRRLVGGTVTEFHYTNPVEWLFVFRQRRARNRDTVCSDDPNRLALGWVDQTERPLEWHLVPTANFTHTLETLEQIEPPADPTLAGDTWKWAQEFGQLRTEEGRRMYFYHDPTRPTRIEILFGMA